MESRVCLLFVIYFVTCILHKNALGESTFSKIFTSFNAYQSDKPLRTVQSIKMITRLNETTTILKDDKSNLDISLESAKNLSERKKEMEISSEKNFLKSRCSRYCIQQMETTNDKNNSVVEDINFFLPFFAGNENKEDKIFNRKRLHNFLLDNNLNMKIIRHVSINDKNSTSLNICEREEKKLVHAVNYTEINFHIDANVTKIVISILRNFSDAVLTTCIKINTEKNNEVLNEDTQSEATNINTKQFSNLRKAASLSENIGNIRTNMYAIPVINSEMNKRSKHAFKRSADIMDEEKKVINNEDEIMTDNFSEVLLPSVKPTVAKNIANYSILTSYGAPKDIKTFNEKIFTIEQQEKIQPRSSEIASLNEDIDTNNMKVSGRNNVLMEIKNSDQDFSTQFARNIGDSLERRKILLEINAKSSLIATPGTTHRVLFDLTNNCVLPVRYAIRARSSQFRILNIQPIYLWLYPQQTNYVTVDLAVPLGTQDSVNTLTLSIDGTDIPEKTVYIYVENAISKNVDDVKPTLEYSFNGNCAGKQEKDRCEETFWSADIIVQDSNSGLKSVISTPNGLYSRAKNFVSGTKERVTFYYLATCCSTTATITAIDVSDNQYSRTIDVTAWDNLSQGEIAAIVLGALLLLLLIILLIVAIVYCIRRRNSHDLPYTQRYGSRPPARSERTSF